MNDTISVRLSTVSQYDLYYVSGTEPVTLVRNRISLELSGFKSDLILMNNYY
jgi:hypothetical protein